MALDAASVIVVAPAGSRPGDAADPPELRAFRLPPLTAVVLHRGTWHWGPYPVTAEAVSLFNVQGLRYREDNHRIDLAAAGAAVDVQIGG
jgi:ureidoglycolate hydrolase